MNGADHRGAGLRAAVRAAIAADDLEDTVRAVLERRFPAEGAGASLDEAGADLGMSPAIVAYIEFAAIQTTSGPGTSPDRSHARRGRA